MRFLVAFFIVFFSCSSTIEKRQFGLNEVIFIKKGKIVKIDTVVTNIGTLKYVYVKIRK